MRWDRQLHSLVAVLLAACVTYLPYSPGSVFEDVSEIFVPIGIAVGLVVVSLWIRRRGLTRDQLKRIVTFGWVGAIATTLASVWWIALHVYRGSPVVGLSDEVLTVWSFGIGAGVLVGTYAAASDDHGRPADRENVLAEATWTDREQRNPIVGTIVEEIAGLEDVEPLELEPLYDHVDPDVFANLRERGNAQWQLRFYTEEYEIRVSGQGVVTVVDSDVSTPRDVSISVR